MTVIMLLLLMMIMLLLLLLLLVVVVAVWEGEVLEHTRHCLGFARRVPFLLGSRGDMVVVVLQLTLLLLLVFVLMVLLLFFRPSRASYRGGGEEGGRARGQGRDIGIAGSNDHRWRHSYSSLYCSHLLFVPAFSPPPLHHIPNRPPSLSSCTQFHLLLSQSQQLPRRFQLNLSFFSDQDPHGLIFRHHRQGFFERNFFTEFFKFLPFFFFDPRLFEQGLDRGGKRGKGI